MDLPPGYPTALGGFAGWMVLSVLLSQLVGLFSDGDKYVEGKAQREASRALDLLNEHLQKVLRPAAPPADDPDLQRPIRDRMGVRQMHQRALAAWAPLRFYGTLTWASDTGKAFCGVHALAALPMGASWWFTDGNRAVTKVCFGVFGALIVPIMVAVALQLWSRAHFGVLPDDE